MSATETSPLTIADLLSDWYLEECETLATASFAPKLSNCHFESAGSPCLTFSSEEASPQPPTQISRIKSTQHEGFSVHSHPLETRSGSFAASGDGPTPPKIHGVRHRTTEYSFAKLQLEGKKDIIYRLFIIENNTQEHTQAMLHWHCGAEVP